MNVLKIVLVLAISIAVYAIVGGQTSIGDGFFEFNAKGKAQDALDEARDVETAMGAYASEYGDGIVRFGDPLQGEELFLYLKDKGLLRGYVGDEENSPIKEWILSEDGESVLGVVKSDSVCKYINNGNHQRPMSEPNPVCGTEDAKGLTCCVEAP